MTLEIRTADDLIDPALEARWAERRADGTAPLLRRILHTFAAAGGPIPIETVVEAFADQPPDRVREALATLDQRDLIQIHDDRIEMAYPFSAVPTAFIARLADGRERYACCAIDALVVAPMLGESVHVRSQCHHCGAPLEFDVDPTRPAPDAEDVMVWIGVRSEGERRIATSP